MLFTPMDLSNQTTTLPAANRQDFESILALEPFKALKAILDHISPDRERLFKGVQNAMSFEDLVVRLGYRLHLTRQIHVQDSYSRLSREGGIKAVLPYHDIPTHSSFPTLVHFDSSITTTPPAAAFFNEVLIALKSRFTSQG